jgi:hypothetical protein
MFVEILAGLRGRQTLCRPQQQLGADPFFQLGDHLGNGRLPDA